MSWERADESTDRPKQDSPWENDVPVTPPPAGFSWAESGTPPASSDPEAHPAGVVWNDPKSSGGFGGLDRSQPNRPVAPAPDSESSDDGDRRRTWFAAAAAAVVALFAAFVLTQTGGDDNAVTGDSIPVVSDPPTDTDATIPEIEDEPDSEPDSEGDADGSGDAAGDDSGEAEPEWETGTIELPGVLASTSEPFTFAVLDRAAGYTEIDVPSGKYRRIEVPRQALASQMSLGATTAMLSPQDGMSGFGLLLNPGAPPIDVRFSQNGNGLSARAGTDEYVAVNYGDSPAEFEIVTVRADGSVELSAVSKSIRQPWLLGFLPDGSILTTDAGGVYRVADGNGASDVDEVTRISTGILIGSSSSHALVRECDESLVCNYVSIASATGERTNLFVPEDDDRTLGAYGSVEVSPDGTALRYTSFGSDGPTDHLVDGATGTSFSSGSASNGNSGFGYELEATWAADSSGYLRVFGAGLQFVDRSTGEAELVDLGPDFESISRVAVRYSSVLSPTDDDIATSSGLRMIALTAAGGVAEIDVDSGEIEVTPAPGLESASSAIVIPDATGAWIVSYDEVPSMRYDAPIGDAAGEVVFEGTPVVPTGPLYSGPTPDSFWELARRSGGLGLQLVDATGTVLGPAIDLSLGEDQVLGSDGRGELVVLSGLGGVYIVGPDAASELTSGELLALGPTTAYVRECDTAFVCGVRVIDRETGARTNLPNGLLSRVGAIERPVVPIGTTVSPDGTAAFVRVDGVSTRVAILDLDSGTQVGVPAVDTAATITWTSDSAYAVWLSDGQLVIFDRANSAVRTLVSEPLKAVAAVPAEFVVAGPDEPVVKPPPEPAAPPPLEPAPEPTDLTTG